MNANRTPLEGRAARGILLASVLGAAFWIALLIAVLIWYAVS